LIEEFWQRLTGLGMEWGIALTAASITMLVISLLFVCWAAGRIPADYFTHHRRHRISHQRNHPLVQAVIMVAKNIVGSLLLIAGFIMLFTPGPGLPCMLIGLIMMNYPGKYRLECWLIRRPLLMQSINLIREKRGQPPLQAPPAG